MKRTLRIDEKRPLHFANVDIAVGKGARCLLSLARGSSPAQVQRLGQAVLTIAPVDAYSILPFIASNAIERLHEEFKRRIKTHTDSG